MRPVRVISTLALLSFASPLAAQELVNGTFDTDLSGWEHTACEEVDPANCLELWVDMDRLDAPDSGAALVRDFSSSGSVNYLWQCVPAVEGQVWTGSGWVLLPSSSPLVDGRLRVSAYSSADCSTGYISRVSSNVVATTDTWTELVAPAYVMPPTTAAVFIQVFPSNTSETVPVTALFDDV